jgi:hypothetical protein
MQARDLLARAIELDPDDAAAHGWLAYWSIKAAGQGLGEEPTRRDDIGRRPSVPSCSTRSTRAPSRSRGISGDLLHDVESALHLHARVTELNPNLPIAWTMSSCSKLYNGELRRRFATRFVEHALMTAQLFNCHLEEADMLSGAVLERNPRHVSPSISVSPSSASGADDEASGHCLAFLGEFDATVTVAGASSRIPIRPDDRVIYEDDIARAGMPR